jgi:DNA-binding MarR family transcriptional regulator
MSRAAIVVRLAKVIEIVLADLDVTPTQFRALDLIAEGVGSPQEMAARLAMKPPNLTKLVDGLAERGLAVRERDTEDGRRQQLSLTPAGSALLTKAGQRADAALKRLEQAAPDTNPLTELDHWLPGLDAAAADLRRQSRGGRE